MSDTKLCRKQLHELTRENLTSSGRCRACRQKTQREWVAAYRAGEIAPPEPVHPEAAASAISAAVTPEERAAATAALVDALEPTMWELAAAVHKPDPGAVEALLAGLDRRAVDVIAIIAVSQLPRAPRVGRAGKTVECGTNEGYAEHIRRGEPTCAACRPAHARANADYRARAKADMQASVGRSAVDALHHRDGAGRVVGAARGPAS
jgi:hypothetical protein